MTPYYTVFQKTRDLVFDGEVGN